jgi:hypothetical protein
MTTFLVNYATPSAFTSDRDRATLGLTPNARRPVRFHARVKEALPLRLALQTLGQLVWSDDTWVSSADYVSVFLDPIVTVHPDRLFFEAFSQDQSVYGLVIADMGLFETDGPVAWGTTNVDFTAWLWAALGEMRSSRETWLRLDPAGFEVATQGAGGRFEQKVDVPDDWVRGFLQLQAAMALPGTRLTVRPVDLLAAIRFLLHTRAKVSPRALRYEFEPGADARIVLEPWERVVPLKGACHNFEKSRVIRTWGRRRLWLIEPLLPYAESVEVYLKGRALPSFYAVKLPGLTFVLGLSGWTESRWTGTGSFDLLATGATDDVLLGHALERLREARAVRVDDLANLLQVDREMADRLLARLCRRGQAVYDVERREFRHRELFETPADETKLFPPDPRAEAATSIIAQGDVAVRSTLPRETRKTKNLHTPEGKVRREVVDRDWHVTGEAGGQGGVEVVVNDSGRIIFGTCNCPFFDENMLNRGPCEHMIALLAASEAQRTDLPTSTGVPH